MTDDLKTREANFALRLRAQIAVGLDPISGGDPWDAMTCCVVEGLLAALVQAEQREADWEKAGQVVFAELKAVKQEHSEAMRVLAPNMPESGLVDACRQVKQAAISSADNCEVLEAKLVQAEQETRWLRSELFGEVGGLGLKARVRLAEQQAADYKNQATQAEQEKALAAALQVARDTLSAWARKGFAANSFNVSADVKIAALVEEANRLTEGLIRKLHAMNREELLNWLGDQYKALKSPVPPSPPSQEQP